MRCSIVVPTRERPRTLERLLQALVRQDLPRDEYEIIICDDGRSADTWRQVERWRRGNDVRITYIQGDRDKRGPAAARNLGWMTASAPVIAFTDDDTVPRRDWVRNGMQALEQGLDAAWGRVVVPLPPVATAHARDVARLADAGFVTANCFCRRESLEEVGGFDPAFPLAWREDSDLYFRMLDRGMQVAHAPEAVVKHPVRPARWGASVAAERKHLYDALLAKRHPKRFRETIGWEAPLDYYGSVASAAVAAVGALSRSPRLTRFGVFAWAMCTASVIDRRLRDAPRTPAHIADIVITSAALPFLSLYWRTRGILRYRR